MSQTDNVQDIFDNVTYANITADPFYKATWTYDNVTTGHFDNATYDNVTDLTMEDNDSFSDPFKALMMLAHFLLCLVILVVNSLTMITHVRNKELKTIQNKYIISLASADFQVGSALANLFFTDYFHDLASIQQCRLTLASLYIAVTVSLLNMLSVALDRYIYIVHPFVYRRIVTSTKTNLLILAQWTLAFAHGYLAAFIIKADDTEACNPFYAYQTAAVRYFLPSSYFIAAIVIGVTYGLIAKTAKKHHDRKQLRVQRIDYVLAKNHDEKSISITNSEVYFKIDVSGDQNVPLPQNCSSDVLGNLEKGKVFLQDKPSKLDGMDSIDVRENLDEANEFAMSINTFGSFNISQSIPESDFILQETSERRIHTRQLMDVEIDANLTLAHEKQKNDISNSEETVDAPPDKSSQSADATADKSSQSADATADKSIQSADAPADKSSQSADSPLDKSSQSADAPADKSSQLAGGLSDKSSQSADSPLDKSSLSADAPSDQRSHSAVSQSNKSSQSAEAANEVGKDTSIKPWTMTSLRWMKQMVVVYGLFLVFWTPNMVYVLSSVFFDINYKVVYILAFLGSANSAVNFFVYSLMSEQFRKAFKKTFMCQCK